MYKIKLIDHRKSDTPQIRGILEMYITQHHHKDIHIGRIYLTESKTGRTAQVYIQDKERILEFYLKTIKENVRKAIVDHLTPFGVKISFVNLYAVKIIQGVF